MGNPPCSLIRAVENVAGAGDEVIVASGDHDLGTSNVTVTAPNLSVHGIDGQPPPRILSNSPDFAVGVNNPTASIRRLAIESTGGATALTVTQGQAEQIFAHATPAAFIEACRLALTSTLLRDSVCWNTGTATGGIALGAFSVSGSSTRTVRNVNAIATGPASVGLSAQAPNMLTQLVVDARNVIAQGTAFDVQAAAGNATSSAAVNLTTSNYVTEDESGPGIATVTDPGPPANQISDPLFADAASGDFHQLTGSPTIDAGSDDGTLGSLDPDGDPRFQAPAVDIGADELVPPAAPEPGGGDATPPETTITHGPKDKTKKKQATFEFSSTEPGSTFECSLDDGAFAPCTSPETEKVKKGRHSFEVRAKDPAGNTDPSPASDGWKVKRRRK